MKFHLKMITRSLVFSSFILILFGCTNPLEAPSQRHGAAEQAIEDSLKNSVGENERIAAKSMQIPNSVESALLPQISLPAEKIATAQEKRFDISANNTPIDQFLLGLVKGTKYNVILSNNLSGNITLNLKSVTVPEVMTALRDVYGYEYQVTPYGFKVTQPTIETRIFTVDYLNVVRAGSSKITVTSASSTNSSSSSSSSDDDSDSGSTTSSLLNDLTNSTSTDGLDSDSDASTDGNTSELTTTTQADFWTELQKTLEMIISGSKNSSVVINPQGGVVIVRANPDVMRDVETYLNTVQNIAHRQVLIEAKIIEVTLNDAYQSGIDWKLFGTGTNPGLGQFGTSSLGDFLPELQTNGSSTSDGLNALFSMSASYKNSFSSIIRLLQTQGYVHVLSSPRVSSMNNQKAVIKVGDEEFYLTDISSTSTATTGAATTSQGFNISPFFSGIALDVTPQIASNGDVLLHIHPSITDIRDQERKFKSGNNNTAEVTLPKTTIRESDSIVRAKNGQIVIIGGLMKTTALKDVAKTPGLADIPFFSNLFKRTGQVFLKTELVILIKPIVIGEKTWSNELRRSLNTTRKWRSS